MSGDSKGRRSVISEQEGGVKFVILAILAYFRKTTLEISHLPPELGPTEFRSQWLYDYIPTCSIRDPADFMSANLAVYT